MKHQLELPLILPNSSSLTKKGWANSSNFLDNMSLPVHRWFRYSAGFSAQWIDTVIAEAKKLEDLAVFDPFAGSGTTLLAAEKLGVECLGVEAHPFINRIARAKLLYRTDPDAYLDYAIRVLEYAKKLEGDINHYPKLIRACFSDESLKCLDQIRQAWAYMANDSSQSELVWLTLVCILRYVSHAGTAPWQYVLPNKKKKFPLEPISAFKVMAENIYADMKITGTTAVSQAKLIWSDARTCKDIPDKFANLVLTSPPYANNYDYADATRLEMCFMGEIEGWGDLQNSVRQYLVRSCSQHVTAKTVDLDEVLAAPELNSIVTELFEICEKLSKERQQRGGKKNYHLMIACYFLDMARVWIALRRVCKQPSTVCFVVGDSAPYGVYVPVISWLGLLAEAAGFDSFVFEETRKRNVKWKNRKHNVPLCEGCLWVRG